MQWNRALSELRNTLAALYPREADSRNVVFDSNIDAAVIAFDNTAVNNWQAILEQALKQGRLDNLISVARQGPFGDNPALLSAIAAFRAAPQSDAPPPPPAPLSLSFNQKTQVVNALLDCVVISNGATRDTIVDQLPGKIKHAIPRNSNARIDVTNIVTTASNYAGGLQELAEVVRAYESDSLGMQAVDRLLGELGLAVVGGAHP